ncbi:hypothetical protein L218DRAFT_173414 [Marasmius fiardii PR-910]|nr:hypothetical protein L218DRAFT_173414 [Marasmius fiardii PR-910]
MTIQPWNKSKITMILMGETGVGKTTMLNLLANMCAGVELDDFAIDVSDDEQGGPRAGSQTLKPVLYNIVCADGKEVDILDTPGLADPRGIDKDTEHREAIVNVIKEKVEAIDAVVILTNSTGESFDPTTYVLDIVFGMFPHSFSDNIVYIFPVDTDPKTFSFPQYAQKSRHWSINNPLAQWLEYQNKLNEAPPVDRDILNAMDQNIRSGYQETLGIVSQLFQWVDKCNVQRAHGIYALHDLWGEIEVSVSNVITRLGQTKIHRSRLEVPQVDLAAIQQQVRSNLSFMYWIDDCIYM